MKSILIAHRGEPSSWPENSYEGFEAVLRAGVRYIDDVNTAVGTFGVEYRINRKYSISAFEQYDFSFSNGENLSTNLTITRKFPRWYGAFTFGYDNSRGEVTLKFAFWPEGIEEFRVGGGRTSILGRSDRN